MVKRAVATNQGTTVSTSMMAENTTYEISDPSTSRVEVKALSGDYVTDSSSSRSVTMVTRPIHDIIKVEPPDEWTEYLDNHRPSINCGPTVKNEAYSEPNLNDVHVGSGKNYGDQPSEYVNLENGVTIKEEPNTERNGYPANQSTGQKYENQEVEPTIDDGEDSNSVVVKTEPDCSAGCENSSNDGIYEEKGELECDSPADTVSSQVPYTELDYADDDNYNKLANSVVSSSEEDDCTNLETTNLISKEPSVVKHHTNGIFDQGSDLGIKPFACDTCDKRFTKAKALRAHKRLHTGEKPYGCSKCSKRFTRYSTLHNHMQTHTDVKPFTCPKCEKQFKQSRHLQQHLKTHEASAPPASSASTEPGSPYVPLQKPPKPRPFACPICGKDFIRSFHLQRHTRSHTGERPYPCETCGKSFRDTSTLHRHMRSHTGERPYKCDICGECFMLSYHLQGHIQTHTGERPFSCETCGKDFMRAFDLQRHKLTHTGEKPFRCSLCDTVFSRSSALHRHLRRHTCPAPLPPNHDDESDSDTILDEQAMMDDEVDDGKSADNGSEGDTNPQDSVCTSVNKDDITAQLL